MVIYPSLICRVGSFVQLQVTNGPTSMSVAEKFLLGQDPRMQF